MPPLISLITQETNLLGRLYAALEEHPRPWQVIPHTSPTEPPVHLLEIQDAKHRIFFVVVSPDPDVLEGYIKFCNLVPNAPEPPRTRIDLGPEPAPILKPYRPVTISPPPDSPVPTLTIEDPTFILESGDPPPLHSPMEKTTGGGYCNDCHETIQNCKCGWL